MFKDSQAFSGFSVDDLDAARAFYGDTLGLDVADDDPGFSLTLATGAAVLVYPTGDGHTPGSYTHLNFPVGDIDTAVEALAAAGVTFEDLAHTDDKGVMRGRSMDMGPDIAWFKDPAGNTLSVLQE